MPLIRNDPEYMRGPCYAPTLYERDRVRELISGMREHLRKDRTVRPYTLGELIEALEDCEPDVIVQFDNGRAPSHFISWRGSYYELSLVPSEEPAGVTEALNRHVTVGELLVICELAKTTTFHGYKGGDYNMDDKTLVWADEYGTAAGWAITGVEAEMDTDEEDGRLILVRSLCDPFDISNRSRMAPIKAL